MPRLPPNENRASHKSEAAILSVELFAHSYHLEGSLPLMLAIIMAPAAILPPKNCLPILPSPFIIVFKPKAIPLSLLIDKEPKPMTPPWASGACSGCS